MSTGQRLSPGMVRLMSIATGVMVANLYYLQALLHSVRSDFHVSTVSASLLMTLVQAGYALGLALILPLGDLIARRTLLTCVFFAAAVAMAAASVLTSFAWFAVLTLLIGVTSVGAQTIVPFAADLAEPAQRGRVIARVMSGLLIGILLSRTAAGLIAQVAGWRAVYWIAAIVLGVTGLVLYRFLPTEPRRTHVRYVTLATGGLSLLRAEPLLRRRAGYGAVAFATFSGLWTTLSFHLAGRPFHYSNAVIGLFGLFGVAGVVAANVVGHVVDRRLAHWSTVVSAGLVAIAFGIVAVGGETLWWLGLGIIVLDAGVQGIHVTNQSVIYAMVTDSRSRINSAYMVSCFLGASLGSYVSGQLYAAYGWSGDCWLGGLLGATLVITVLTERFGHSAPLARPRPNPQYEG